MNPNPIGEQLESIDRVLRAARSEFSRGCNANAVLFLRAAIGNLNDVAKTLEGAADVVPLRQPKKANP